MLIKLGDISRTPAYMVLCDGVIIYSKRGESWRVTLADAGSNVVNKCDFKRTPSRFLRAMKAGETIFIGTRKTGAPCKKVSSFLSIYSVKRVK